MRPIDESICVSGQVMPDQIEALKAAGFTMLVQNRPDGEAPGQPASAELAAAAEAAGMTFRYVPLGPAGLSPELVDAMGKALDAAEGKVLAFCAAGMRSTFLWAVARAARGDDAESLVAKAAAAGYDLTPIRAYLD